MLNWGQAVSPGEALLPQASPLPGTLTQPLVARLALGHGGPTALASDPERRGQSYWGGWEVNEADWFPSASIHSTSLTLEYPE